MKIEIDTHHDRREHIQAAIKLLHEITSDTYTNYSPSNSGNPSDGGGFMNMFGSNDPSPTQNQPSTPSQSEIAPSGLFDLFKDDKGNEEATQPARQVSDLPPYVDDYDPYEDATPTKPTKANIVKESDIRAKKFNFPDDQISIIEY